MQGRTASACAFIHLFMISAPCAFSLSVCLLLGVQIHLVSSSDNDKICLVIDNKYHNFASLDSNAQHYYLLTGNGAIHGIVKTSFITRNVVTNVLVIAGNKGPPLISRVAIITVIIVLIVSVRYGLHISH